MKIIPILLLLFPLRILAQSTEGLVPDAFVSEADAVEIQSVLDKLDLIERPSMDGEVLPPPPVIDMGAPNYLELVYYRMITALHERALREGKAPDYYVNIFKTQWEAEHVQSSGEALRVIKMVEPACPDGFEIYEGSGICNQFPTHVSAEQNYYHCSLNNYQLWLENAELKKQLMLKSIPDFKDGANKGNLWKPIADPKATCSGGTTILLDQQYDAPVIGLEILDANLISIRKPTRLQNMDDGRPRYCERTAGAQFGSGPLYIKFGNKLFRVNNPANRED